MFRVRKVYVSYGEKQKIAILMGVSESTVYNALNYKTHTILSRRIRNLAKKRGGFYIEV